MSHNAGTIYVRLGAAVRFQQLADWCTPGTVERAAFDGAARFLPRSPRRTLADEAGKRIAFLSDPGNAPEWDREWWDTRAAGLLAAWETVQILANDWKV